MADIRHFGHAKMSTLFLFLMVHLALLCGASYDDGEWVCGNGTTISFCDFNTFDKINLGWCDDFAPELAIPGSAAGGNGSGGVQWLREEYQNVSAFDNNEGQMHDYFLCLDNNNTKATVGSNAGFEWWPWPADPSLLHVCVEFSYATNSFHNSAKGNNNGAGNNTAPKIPNLFLHVSRNDGTSEKFGEIEEDTKFEWRTATFDVDAKNLMNIAFKSRLTPDRAAVVVDDIRISRAIFVKNETTTTIKPSTAGLTAPTFTPVTSMQPTPALSTKLAGSNTNTILPSATFTPMTSSSTSPTNLAGKTGTGASTLPTCTSSSDNTQQSSVIINSQCTATVTVTITPTSTQDVQLATSSYQPTIFCPQTTTPTTTKRRAIKTRPTRPTPPKRTPPPKKTTKPTTPTTTTKPTTTKKVVTFPPRKPKTTLTATTTDTTTTTTTTTKTSPTPVFTPRRTPPPKRKTRPTIRTRRPIRRTTASTTTTTTQRTRPTKISKAVRKSTISTPRNAFKNITGHVSTIPTNGKNGQPITVNYVITSTPNQPIKSVKKETPHKWWTFTREEETILISSLGGLGWLLFLICLVLLINERRKRRKRVGSVQSVQPKKENFQKVNMINVKSF